MCINGEISKRERKASSKWEGEKNSGAAYQSGATRLLILLIPQLPEVAAASPAVAGGLHLGHDGYGYLLWRFAAYIQAYGSEHSIELLVCHAPVMHIFKQARYFPAAAYHADIGGFFAEGCVKRRPVVYVAVSGYDG